MSGIVGGNLGRGSGLIKAGAIDDNSVTLAKMAGLARGNLIYGDTSGDPAALAVGGADEVLTHDGTDLAWAAAGGGTALTGSTNNTVTTVTGAMKNAFGGLLNFQRHWTHPVIHETLVDLLRIQKQIHPGVFAVTDGTFAGSGPGPRAMEWHEKNVILAGEDQVSVDAVSARMMGFDPMSIKFIRLAHEAGLGCGDISEIEIVGEDISDVDWGFQSGNTFASKGQKLIYWGPLKPLENALLRSPITPWAYFASNLYHNEYWLRFIGKKRIEKAMKTEWGVLFQSY